jgi:hypothetical protein
MDILYACRLGKSRKRRKAEGGRRNREPGTGKKPRTLLRWSYVGLREDEDAGRS